MKKTHHIIIYFILATLLMGCNTSEIFEEPSPRDLAEELIENYITALSKRDYETIRQLANIPVTPLVPDTSIESYLIEKGADQLIGENLEIKSIDLDSSGQFRDFTVTFLPEGNTLTYSDSIALKENTWYLPLTDLYIDEWQFMVPPNIQINIEGVDASLYNSIEPGVISVLNVAPEPFTITSKPIGSVPVEITVTPSGLEPTSPLFEVYADDSYANEATSWYINALNSIMRSAAKGEDINKILPYFDMDSYNEDGLQNLYKIIQQEHEGFDVQISQYEIYTYEDESIQGPRIINDNGDIYMTHLLSYNWVDQFGFSKSMFLIEDVTLTATNGSFKIASLGDSARALTWVNHFSDDR